MNLPSVEDLELLNVTFYSLPFFERVWIFVCKTKPSHQAIVEYPAGSQNYIHSEIELWNVLHTPAEDTVYKYISHVLYFFIMYKIVKACILSKKPH